MGESNCPFVCCVCAASWTCFYRNQAPRLALGPKWKTCHTCVLSFVFNSASDNKGRNGSYETKHFLISWRGWFRFYHSDSSTGIYTLCSFQPTQQRSPPIKLCPQLLVLSWGCHTAKGTDILCTCVLSGDALAFHTLKYVGVLVLQGHLLRTNNSLPWRRSW